MSCILRNFFVALLLLLQSCWAQEPSFVPYIQSDTLASATSLLRSERYQVAGDQLKQIGTLVQQACEPCQSTGSTSANVLPKQEDQHATQVPSAAPVSVDCSDEIFNDRRLQEPLVTCAVRDSSARDALMLLATLGNLDLVVDVTVTGSIELLQCNNVSIGKALRALCVNTQPRLALSNEYGVWQVMSAAKATLLKKQRKEFYDHASYVARSYQLAHLSCTPEVRKAIEQLWQQLVTSYQAQATYLSVDEQARRIFFRASKQVADEFAAWLAQVDRPQAQVRLDVRVVLASKDFEDVLGFEWSGVYNRRASVSHVDFVGVGPITTPEDTASHQFFKDMITWSLNLIPSGIIAKTIKVPFVFGNHDLSTKRLNLLLNAAETRHQLKTILKPSLLVQNETCAQVMCGQELPHEVRLDETIEGKLSNVTTTNYKPIGIRLSVKPRIATALDAVVLEIYVENSSVARPRIPLEHISDGKQNRYEYTILTAQSRSTVRLKSGQTTMISGLVTHTKETQETGVPWLQNIPLVGWLFKGKRNAQEDKQLLIFITPTVQQETC